jgi:hypothetical protein
MHKCVLALGVVLVLSQGSVAKSADGLDARRVESLVDALTNGIHGRHVVLQETGEKKGDPELYSRGERSLSEVTELAAITDQLMSENARADVVAWARDEKTTLDVQGLVDRLRSAPRPRSDRLPAALLEATLGSKVSPADMNSARAIANMAQLIFVEPLRGALTDQQVRLYQALGLKLNFKQLGLPNQDDDFLVLAKELAPRTAPAPFATDEYAWRFVLRLIENWGDKQTGIRDKTVLARELLSDPAIEPLLPTLRALPPKRVAFLGHSLMINRHWSSLGAWSSIAGETMRQINPGFDYKDFQGGNLTMSRAVREHLDNLIAYRPTETFILTSTPRSAADLEALVKVLSALRGIGCQTYVIDDVRPWGRMGTRTPETRASIQKACEETGAHQLEWLTLAQHAPGHERWAAIDNIHMATDGHIFFAKELLKHWAKPQ